jgi:conjugative relaxase-like TrwC/TraI family protein
MMTMHVLSAGDGYKYYTCEVATGDVKRDRDRELGDYYTADGNPPGRWVGGGTDLLGVSGTVTEAQMRALFGEGLHPDADRIIADEVAAGKSASQAQQAAKLGRSYYAYQADVTTLRARIQAGYVEFERVNGYGADTAQRRLIRTEMGVQAFREAKLRDPADGEELGKFITAATRPTQQAVAGFDLVCSPAKSVSVLWALGDEDTRKAIEAAQDKAVQDTVRYLEREAIATRAGTNGVAQLAIEGGIVVTAFRHFESRNGDPQLHDHLVVANKVMGSDRKWRSIDSKLLHREAVAASEFYNATIISEVCERLGVTSVAREPSPGKRTVMEIAGINPEEIDMFSSRSATIRQSTDRLVAEYQRDHGRAPDEKARIQLAQQATLESRPRKDHSRSPQATREAAQARVAPERVASVLADAQAIAEERATAGRIPIDVQNATREVLREVEDRNAVWGANVIRSQARHWVAERIPDRAIAEPLVDQIVAAALQESVSLTPPSPHAGFQPLVKGAAGDTHLEHKGKTLYTSQAILAAEDALLEGARTRTMRPVEVDVFERVAAAHDGPLDAGQRDLARVFATSDLELVAGIGPAGAGKTTALRLAADTLTAGGSRMVGLAPSAPAAAVLSRAVGIEATTIHGFLTAHEQDQVHEKYALRPGDVIVVDEAGMAGTKRLWAVLELAQQHGAHVRLIGDDRQLAAVEAGGALRLIDREVGSVQLEHVHRFRDAAEADASLGLRDPLRPGDPFAWYRDEGRIVGGSAETMTGMVFADWQQDITSGVDSMMLAATADAVAELNARAQAFRMASGDVVDGRAVALRDGLSAHVGDLVATRRNESDLRILNGRDRVKNGDLWHVTTVGDDGSLTVTHKDHGAPVILPPGYVAKHVELGYARTISRSQGLTTERARVLGTPSMSREDAYTALSRGKERNSLYLALEDAETVSDALEQIADRSERLLSAHETIRAEQARVEDIVTLSNEHAYVAERANEIRYARVVELALGADRAAALQPQQSWGALAASLRHAEDYGYDPVDTLRDAYKQREISTAEDVPAVLHWRIEKALDGLNQPVVSIMDRPDVDGVPGWIADGRHHHDPLLPAQWREHLAERHHYIGVRLRERGATLAVEQPAWTQDLGRLPAEPERMSDWHRTAAEIDVLRSKYRIDPSETQAIPYTIRGNPVADQLQERVTALHAAAAQSTAPEVADDTRAQHQKQAQELAGSVRQAIINRAQTHIQEATTATRNIATEGITMSDPIDETLEHLGRHAGRVGQSIANEIGRAAQRSADERRRQQLDAQRKAEREQEIQARNAKREADRGSEEAARAAARHNGDATPKWERDATNLPPTAADGIVPKWERDATNMPSNPASGSQAASGPSEQERQSVQQRDQQQAQERAQQQAREQEQAREQQRQQRQQEQTRDLERGGDTLER